MDHEYELEDDYAPRILWGRLAFFAIALLLAFLFGRCTKDAGRPEAEYQEQVAQVLELSSENEVLRQQLAAANNDEEPEGGGGDGGGDGNGGNDAEATEEPADEGDDGAVGEEGTTYIVKEGDTLTTIAEEFYGDPTKFDLIVDANNLDESTGLRVGQELIIPPDPDA